MFDPGQLWKSRFSGFLKELSRYLRYIFNGHLVIVLLFLAGTFGFYYQEWVQTLHPDFPAALIVAVVLSLAVTHSPVITFLTEADKVFLLPLETRLVDYFKRSGVFSMLLQSYILLMLLAVLMPMQAAVSGQGFGLFFYYLLALIGLKVANMLIRWRVQYFIEQSVWRADTVVRLLLNGGIIYLLFSGAYILSLLLGVVLLLLLYYFYVQTAAKGLKWESLIELEERRMSAFYRIANLFTDVPKLKNEVKRRKWLDVFLPAKFGADQAFGHIAVRTFLRSGDYLGLFVRLTAIGAAAVYLVEGIGQIIAGLLFLYLTGFQLLPLRQHHQHKLWFGLYPIKEEMKEKAFRKLLVSLLVLEAAVFAAVPALKQNWDLAGVLLLLSAGFIVLLVYVYSPKRSV